MQHVTPATDLGWAVTELAAATVHLFDHDLRLVARVPVPLEGARMSVSATRLLVAVGDKQQLAVLDHSGALRWRSPWDRFAGDATAGADFHLDGDDNLWIRLGDAKKLIAVHAATGREIHRVPLPGPEAAWFLHRPLDAWTGLALVEPDPSPAMLVGLEAERITLRPLAGHDLADFSPAGDHYLTVSLDGFLSVRDVATDAVIADRHLDDLSDTAPRPPSWRFLDRAMFLTDELVLTAIIATDVPDDGEEHLLLAARSLRHRSRVRYPHLHNPGAIHPAQRPGRWLTHDRSQDLLQLWQLDGRLDDEPLPGQIALL